MNRRRLGLTALLAPLGAQIKAADPMAAIRATPWFRARVAEKAAHKIDATASAAFIPEIWARYAVTSKRGPFTGLEDYTGPVEENV